MDIPELKQALLDPSIYDDHPEKVAVVETHISLVFLTGAFVYKVKKPVNFGFLDFTSLEKRRYYCEQEMRLNRRLAPDLYVGVARITEDRGRIAVEGQGEVKEYAVKMKQISEEMLLDRLLQKGQVTPRMIGAISETLARFYASAETGDHIKSFAKPARIKQDTDENFEQTTKYIGVTLSAPVFSDIQRKTNAFFERNKSLFEARIASDKIRDCHGDLRWEHIFWGESVSIFDCIEFNERFRYTDVAADIGFLAMDLDFHGREDLSEHLIETYVAVSDDRTLRDMLDFYKCYRAYVRGKVESFRLDDPNMPGGEKEGARKRAQAYFLLSHRYALNL